MQGVRASDVSGTYQCVQPLANAAAVMGLAFLTHISAKEQQDASLAFWVAKQRGVVHKLCWVLEVGYYQVLHDIGGCHRYHWKVDKAAVRTALLSALLCSQPLLCTAYGHCWQQDRPSCRKVHPWEEA